MTNKVALDALCADILAHGVPSATLGAYADEIRRGCSDSMTDAIAERLIENFLLRSEAIEVYDEEYDEYVYEASIYDRPMLKDELLKTICSTIIGKEAGK